MKKPVHPAVAVVIIIAAFAIVGLIYWQKTRVIHTDEKPPGMPADVAAAFAERMSKLGQQASEASPQEGAEAAPQEAAGQREAAEATSGQSSGDAEPKKPAQEAGPASSEPLAPIEDRPPAPTGE